MTAKGGYQTALYHPKNHVQVRVYLASIYGHSIVYQSFHFALMVVTVVAFAVFTSLTFLPFNLHLIISYFHNFSLFLTGSPSAMGEESRKEAYDSFGKGMKADKFPHERARRDTMDEPDYDNNIPTHLGQKRTL